MPYYAVNDLPKDRVDPYNPHHKNALLKARTSAYDVCGGDQHRAFAVTPAAAKRAGEGPGPGSRWLVYAWPA